MTTTRKTKRAFSIGQEVSVYHGSDYMWRPAIVVKLVGESVKVRFTGERPACLPPGTSECLVFPNEIR